MLPKKAEANPFSFGKNSIKIKDLDVGEMEQVQNTSIDTW